MARRYSCVTSFSADVSKSGFTTFTSAWNSRQKPTHTHTHDPSHQRSQSPFMSWMYAREKELRMLKLLPVNVLQDFRSSFKVEKSIIFFLNRKLLERMCLFWKCGNGNGIEKNRRNFLTKVEMLSIKLEIMWKSAGSLGGWWTDPVTQSLK